MKTQLFWAGALVLAAIMPAVTLVNREDLGGFSRLPRNAAEAVLGGDHRNPLGLKQCGQGAEPGEVCKLQTGQMVGNSAGLYNIVQFQCVDPTLYEEGQEHDCNHTHKKCADY